MMLRLRRFWIRATADRRRFGMLCVALSVALLLWARLIIVTNMPRMAIAVPEGGAARTAGAPVQTGPVDVQRVEVRLDEFPMRDAFRIPSRQFPLPEPAPGAFRNEPKSGPETAENQMEVEANLRRQLQMLVDSLTLDAVMPTASLALIGGQAYSVGTSVPAGRGSDRRFLLIEVGHRSVTLEHEGHRFELKMRSPIP